MNISEQDKVLMKFPVLWEGWASDSVAWIMERKDGTRYLKMTNHGSAYAADVSELEEQLSEYEHVILETKKALSLLNC